MSRLSRRDGSTGRNRRKIKKKKDRAHKWKRRDRGPDSLPENRKVSRGKVMGMSGDMY